MNDPPCDEQVPPNSSPPTYNTAMKGLGDENPFVLRSVTDSGIYSSISMNSTDKRDDEEVVL